MIKQIGKTAVTVTVKKNLRYVRLTVTPKGEVKLSVPYGYPMYKAENFVLSKTEWIEKHIKKKKELPPCEITEGAELTVLGKKLRFVRVSGREKNASESNGVLTVRSCESSFKKIARQYVCDVLKDYLTERADFYCRLTGLSHGSVSVSKMRGKWGECNISTHDLKFSTYLAFKPVEAIDYVVLHEVAHLKYARHDRLFYSYIEDFMPDYKARAKLLF